MVSLADSSDEEEDEEEQGMVDEELRKSVKAALGSAAVHSDEEDVSKLLNGDRYNCGE